MHIKSRMLLPDEGLPLDDEETDPRDELVKQLLEYQIFKDAAFNLDSRPLLERDVFKAGHISNEPDDAHENENIDMEMDIFDLVEAFHRIISSLGDDTYLEMDVEKMSLSDRINEIMDRLTLSTNMIFSDLIMERGNRKMIVYTFLAILELMKLKMIKVYQPDSFGIIRIFLSVES
jgi:segregation and condensation protein A